MRISTRSTIRAMPLSAALREHIARRLRFALGPVFPRVPVVSVAVGDENGPRGGEDKFCSIRAEVDGLGAVFVRDRHADLYAAISLAAARVGRAVLRAVRRSRRIDRSKSGVPLLELASPQTGGVS